MRATSIKAARKFNFNPLIFSGAIVLVGLSLSVFSELNYREAATAWQTYAGRAAKIDNLMLSIQQEIGYGGFVHNFKNLVLRRDLVRYEATIDRNIILVRKQLDALKSEMQLEQDREQIAIILDVFEEYFSKYEILKQMVRQGRSPEEIDARVKVNDTTALDAFSILNTRIYQRLVSAKAESDHRFLKAQQLLWASQFLFVLSVLFAGVLLFRSDKRLKRSLEEAEVARNVMDAAEIGFWEVNPQNMSDGKWSAVTAQIHEVPDGYQVNPEKGFAFFKEGASRDTIMRVFTEALETGKGYDVELELETFKGNPKWVRTVGIPVVEEGKVIRIYGLVQDITQRKQAEQNLRENEFKLRAFVENTPVPVAMFDRQMNYMVASDEWISYYGLPQDVMGRCHYDLFPDLPKEWHAVHQRGLAGETIEDKESRWERADGNVYWYHWIVTPWRDDTGAVLGIIIAVQDITALKQAEMEATEARDAAEKANAAKSEFLSSMSHELRTPLNAILGYAQLLQADGHLDVSHQEDVSEIFKAGQHLLELINEVLDLSRIETGRLELSLEAVSVHDVVQECLHQIQPLAKAQNIRLDESGLSGLWVKTDRLRFKQVLLNLISNAIKYNQDSGSVHVEGSAEGKERVRITVSDTGRGIAAERMGELFQPFNRLGAETGNIAGAGVGLTITKKYIEMMGGNVSVQSEVGAGSKFIVELPVAMPAEVDESMTDPRHPISLDTAHIKATRTILCIEDNPANLRFMQALIGKQKNIDLLCAHMPSLGIELARAHQPDLILLDINMPDMNGYEVLAQLKSEPTLGAVPVFAVTANAMEKDIQRGKIAGFAEYVTKPIEVTNFLALLDRYLAKVTDTK